MAISPLNVPCLSESHRLQTMGHLAVKVDYSLTSVGNRRWDHRHSEVFVAARLRHHKSDNGQPVPV